MKDGAFFLSLDHVAAIHRRMIEEFGGDPAVVDVALLESAVAMPAARAGAGFLHRGIPAMAAAYLYHVTRNRAFACGNASTALASAEAFILLNGRRLDATNKDLQDLMLGVAGGRVSKAGATAFLRKRVVSGGPKRRRKD